MPMTRIRYTLNQRVRDPKDWAYSWSLRDDQTISTNCDFCGQPGQRVTYEVTRGEERMWICLRCVGRYPVGGTLNGNRLSPRAARGQVHGLTARLKQQTCHDTIREIQRITADPGIEEAFVYFDRNLQLSPQRAALLFAALPLLSRPVDPRIFEVQTRSTLHQDEFGALDDGARTRVWAALSPLQRRRLASLGHAPSGARRAPGRQARSDPNQLTGSRMTDLSETAGPDHAPIRQEKSAP